MTSFVVSTDPEAMIAIKRPETNLVVWERSSDPELGPWLAALLPDLQEVSCKLSAASRVQFPDDPYDPSPLVENLPEHPLRDRLKADLARILRLFARSLGDTPRLHVSLAPVHNDMCRKLHVDRVLARLVTTYLGPGTEWAPNDAVAREFVAASACCPADHNKRVMRDPLALRRAKAGDIVVMKGEAWPGNAGLGAVHRSPKIAEAGGRRLVFVATWLAPIVRGVLL